MKESIIIKGARENNLQNINLTIPRNKLIVFTGLSGSGKTSLAFDTIYAEGQRRYVESLSSYARMFLDQKGKPDVDYIDGLSPAISIDQKTTSKNPRSTVGTVTEIYDYLRLLYARIGVPHSPICGKEIKQQTIDQIVDKISIGKEDSKVYILAPVVRGRKGEYQKNFENYKRSGFVRVRVDGIIYDLDEKIPLDKNKKHNIDVIVDRLKLKEGIQKRLSDSCDTASTLSGGLVLTFDPDTEEEQLFSMKYTCPDHDIAIDDLAPRMFSFNSPVGACPTCSGLGVINMIDPNLVIPDRKLSFLQEPIKALGFNNLLENPSLLKTYGQILKKYGEKLSTPIKDLNPDALNEILYGNDFYEGVIPIIERRYKTTTSLYTRYATERLMTHKLCQDCKGARLNKISRVVTVGELNMFEFCSLSVVKAYEYISNLKLSKKDEIIASEIIKEIKSRLTFLENVGLGYLTLARSAATLSGGEAQRIRLATQIGSSLMGVLYILDEPSIGLHQRDNQKLLDTLKNLRDIGNTVIVVEHDEDTMKQADYIVDIGPGAGIHGGKVVAAGTYDEIVKNEKSLTGQYLSGKKKIELPKDYRKPNGKFISIKGASENNLKNIDVDIPLGVMTSITGVSGSGKSTLVNEVLYKSLMVKINGSNLVPGKCREITGYENIDGIIDMDQSPIGRTPRSNPATYTGVFNEIRALFAKTPEAVARGYKPNRFSFNVQGGRCEACAGDGIVKIEMHFLPDVYVPCDVCNGKRYNRETLEIKYKGKNIFDVLDMTVEEGMKFFENMPAIYRKLKTLYDVGLGYIKIGQSSTTLSGGEAQRVKLATELSKKFKGHTLYILDEPTTGLHTADVARLIDVLHRLVDAGNSVVVIEHNLDVIKSSDYIIDLGPEGGDAGGTVVAVGNPREVAACEKSFTGQFLKKYFE